LSETIKKSFESGERAGEEGGGMENNLAGFFHLNEKDFFDSSRTFRG
jgi:hypothetical protein